MNTEDLINYFNNHPKLTPFVKGTDVGSGTVISLKDGRAYIGYCKKINSTLNNIEGKINKKLLAWYSNEDMVKELHTSIPKDKIKLHSRSITLLKEGQFIQILHKSGHYYLICTTEDIKKQQVRNKILASRSKTICAKLNIDKISIDDVIFEKVGIYKSNDERIRRKPLIIKMLGDLNCLNTHR